MVHIKNMSEFVRGVITKSLGGESSGHHKHGGLDDVWGGSSKGGGSSKNKVIIERRSEMAGNVEGEFFAPEGQSDTSFGEIVTKKQISPDAKIFKYESSYAYAAKNELLDIERPDLKKKYGPLFNSLRDLWNKSWDLQTETQEENFMETQKTVASHIKQKENADIIYFTNEDALNPEQYMILNPSILEDVKENKNKS